MTTAIHYLLASAAFCWLQLLLASLLHARGWTPAGMLLAFGNRGDMPEPTPLVGRAKRAATNTVENLVLLAVVTVAAALGGADPERVAFGLAIFFWARVAHWALYLAGVAYLRTASWAVSLAGLYLIGAAALG